MIIVECNPDKYVIKRIIPRKRIIHGGGKTEVLRELGEQRRAVGIVDEDPNSNPPGEMKKYIKEDTRDTIELLRRKNDAMKCLIQLSPDLEGWLINRAARNGIRMEDYNLPNDRKKLHDIANIEKNLDFQTFIKRLLRTSDNEINTIRNWIKAAIG